MRPPRAKRLISSPHFAFNCSENGVSVPSRLTTHHRYSLADILQECPKAAIQSRHCRTAPLRKTRSRNGKSPVPPAREAFRIAKRGKDLFHGCPDFTGCFECTHWSLIFYLVGRVDEVNPFVSTRCIAAGLVACSVHLYPSFKRSIPPKRLSPPPRITGEMAICNWSTNPA
jgi:hypothetical protein